MCLTPLHPLCVNRLKQKVLLVFDGVDTVASISLNGIIVARTENMFRRYVCQVLKHRTHFPSCQCIICETHFEMFSALL